MRKEDIFLQEIDSFCDEVFLLLRKTDPVSRFNTDIPTMAEIEADWDRIFGTKSEANL